MPKFVKILLLSAFLTVSLAFSSITRAELAGDLNNDFKVNSKDLRTFAWQWLDPACLAPGCISDLDGADGVNMADFALFARTWKLEESHPVISEFLASNASNKPPLPPKEGDMLDSDGDSSDWIEIYNPTDIPVNLSGWYLTDSDANLTMWRFPDIDQLEPGEFLLVFASGKNRLDPNELHTNFELDQDRDYLALVGPDGMAVIHEYYPEFPQQLTDVSYGLTQYAATLVPAGTNVSYHVPTSGDAVLGTGWSAVDFDDSTWETGKTGLGFGVGGEPRVAYNDCVYRSDQYIAENVTTYGIGNGFSGSTSGTLIDQATGEDTGITVALTESGGVNWQPDPSGGGSDCAIGTDAYSTFGGVADMTGVIYYGSAGWWVDLTFTGLDPATEYTFATSANRGNPSYTTRWANYTLTGADTYTNASTSGVNVLAENKVQFNTGYNYDTGYVARWTGITAADGSFTVRAEADPSSESGYRAYTFDVFKLEGGFSGTDIKNDMIGVNASLWIRTEFNLELGEPEIFDTLTLRMKYEDGFVAYLNDQEVARRNAPSSVQWNSTADSNRPIQDASVFEVINLTAFLGTLQVGKNVLAIHGLNDSSTNPNFLILPELTAASNMTVPQYFTTPTPGKFNIPGAKGVVSEVWFSHKRGFYDTPFQLILSTEMDDAEIRYTLDGSQPTITNGTVYTGPLYVDKTTTIRATAVKPGWLDSEVATHTYIFLDDVVTQSPNGEAPGPGWPTGSVNGQVLNYGMDPDIVNDGTWGPQLRGALVEIPTISLVTDLDNLFDSSIGIYVNAYQDGRDWERPVSAELLNPNGSEGFQIDAGLRIRGAFSRSGSNPKHALRLFFRSVYGAGKLRYPLFGSEGVDEFDKVDLRTSQNYSWSYEGSSQNTFIRDVFSRDVQHDMGQPYTRSRYYHLYINGHYWGLYQTQERADADFAESYLGGDKVEYDVIKNDSSASRVLHATDGTMAAYQRLYNAAVAGFSTNLAYLAVQGLQPDGTPDPSGERLLDPENVMDYMICTYYTGDPDAPVSCWGHFSNNVFAIYNRVLPQGFTWYRHDAEHSLGANGGINEGRLLTDPTDRTIGQYWEHFNPAWLHLRLTANPEYFMQFVDRVHKYFWNGGLLTAAPNIQRWLTRADQIDLAIIAESARWGDSKTHPPRTKNDWEGQNNYMVNTFFPGRTQIVINQMRSVDMFPDLDAPVFKINGSYQHGGYVSAGDVLTMDNPNGSGTIYYTIDGSDPREPVTGNAVGIPYAPVTLNKSTLVKARVRVDNSTWSALNEATYAIGPVAENLRITEIMYHPKETGNPNDPNREFIELKNIGPDILNLNLVRFTEGIDFTFPDTYLNPNECVVVVKDQSAFEAKYGTSVNVAGQYTGSLANNGEQIKLVDAIGQTILDFEYKDGWHSITDGGGFSLTIIDPTDQTLYGWEEGLVAHWKFDDGAGTTAIDSAGTNNGTLMGDPTWTTGRIGGALNFDGVGDYVSVAPIAVLAGANFTAQAWVNVDASAGVWNPVLMQHDLSNNGCYFYVANKKPSFYLIEGGGFVQAVSPEILSADRWYHIAATNDGSNLKLYVDGQLKGSGSSAGMTGVNYDAYIGCEPVSLLYYNGLIDDFRIYDRAVSESEFQGISDPMARWSRKDSWRASVYRNGSPGWDDSGILPNPGAIVINEVMSHSNAGPDWIELYNTTSKPINIGGWFLSDNNRDEPNLMKYRIANGTMINGDDYRVFYQDTDFNNPGDPGCLIPFALSENGEKVCLSSHQDLDLMLTGYREVEDFGASATNVSFGRYYKSSTGNFNFVAMDFNTPDSNNAYPKVGPVVINEIMYNPPTGNQKEEYIELYNITGAAVTLWRIDKNTSWKFTDGIDYTFSSSPPVTIPANGYLLLVKDLASFTARYGSIPGVQIVQGYDGWLSNSGEQLQIGMPGDIDNEGTRYYIRIDRVTYSDGSHPEDVPGGVDLWPKDADGLGKSLSRKVPTDYGNDVANWQAASPSPGAANP